MGIPHADIALLLLRFSNHKGVLLHSDVLGDSSPSDNVELEPDPFSLTGMVTALWEMLLSTFVCFLPLMRQNTMDNVKLIPTTKPIQIPIMKIKVGLFISFKLRIYSSYFSVCPLYLKITNTKTNESHPTSISVIR